MGRILLLEDDISLTEGLLYMLRREGHEVRAARSVREVQEALSRDGGGYDLLLFDVTLPDGSGFDVCQSVRDRGMQTPILFLTASDEETDIIRGLDSGGDDYLTKPFRIGELCSRIRALLRRAGAGEQVERLSSGDLSVRPLEGKVYRGGQALDLTAMEYRLLCLLLKNKDRVLTREQILDRLWDGNGSFVDDNTLSVYIRRLREKVEESPSSPAHLLTVRGFGYRWKD